MNPQTIEVAQRILFAFFARTLTLCKNLSLLSRREIFVDPEMCFKISLPEIQRTLRDMIPLSEYFTLSL